MKRDRRLELITMSALLYGPDYQGPICRYFQLHPCCYDMLVPGDEIGENILGAWRIWVVVKNYLSTGGSLSVRSYATKKWYAVTNEYNYNSVSGMRLFIRLEIF